MISVQFSNSSQKENTINISDSFLQHAGQNYKEDLFDNISIISQSSGLFETESKKKDEDKYDNNLTLDNYKKTMDGKISSDASQAAYLGDCWLVAGLQSMAATPEGRKAIKESLEYTEDGGAIVHLKGIGDFEVSKQSIEFDIGYDKDKNVDFSGNNDADLVIFEQAFMDALKAIGTGKIKFDKDKVDESMRFMFEPERLKELGKQIEKGETVYSDEWIDGGQEAFVFYALTGKMPEIEVFVGFDFGASRKINNILDDKKDNKNIALGFSLCSGKKNPTITDIKGQTHNLPTAHAYSIVSVNDKYVTFKNPYDSSVNITVSRKEFVKLTKQDSKFHIGDLSDNNKAQKVYEEAA